MELLVVGAELLIISVELLNVGLQLLVKLKKEPLLVGHGEGRGKRKLRT